MQSTTSKVFMKAGASLSPLTKTPYSQEANLQELLELHPELLAGDQMDPSCPRRWLLVGREIGIEDVAGRGARWSADHLFVDQDGIATFVECKRSSDPRIRREIVGQIFEYASQAVRNWPEDRLAALAREKGVEDAVGEALGVEDAAAFWKDAGEKLRSGNIRLVLVADEIPVELRTITHFLNDRMKDDIEVFAVEVRQYTDGEHTVLVPFLVNPPATTSRAAEATRKRHPKATPERFRHELDRPDVSRDDAAYLERVLALFQALEQEGVLEIDGGTGKAARLMAKAGGMNLLSIGSEPSARLYSWSWDFLKDRADVLRAGIAELTGVELRRNQERDILRELRERDPDLKGLGEWLRMGAGVASGA